MLKHIFSLQFVRFSLIGVINTLIHVFVVVTLVELIHTPAPPANGLAFISANLFSFWINSRWTFGTPIQAGRYLRFLVISLAGLLIALTASVYAERMHWHYLAGVTLSFIVLPVLSFFGHKLWTWRQQ